MLDCVIGLTLPTGTELISFYTGNQHALRLSALRQFTPSIVQATKLPSLSSWMVFITAVNTYFMQVSFEHCLKISLAHFSFRVWLRYDAYTQFYFFRFGAKEVFSQDIRKKSGSISRIFTNGLILEIVTIDLLPLATVSDLLENINCFWHSSFALSDERLMHQT